MSSDLVLVVGAGPSGLTMAIELKRLGLDVRLIDKSEHGAQYSQALVVQARTMEQLQRYGIAETAVERGKKLTHIKFWSDRKNILAFDLSIIPGKYPYALFLPQNETERLLAEHLLSLGVKPERGVEIESLSEDKQITAVVRCSDGSLETINPRWVIGCDGAHSKIRELTKTPFVGGGIGLYFFLGDMEIEGPDAPIDELAIHFHKGDVVVMGRLTDKVTRLIVALHSKQEDDTNRKLTVQDFQDAVDHACVNVKVLSGEWMTPFRVNDLQAKHYRIGSAFLAGDASHIHSPVGGQGMNTGMQDVANLAWKLAAVARGADDSLLDSYEQERGEVGKALLSFTERGLKMATSTNPILAEARDILAPIITKLHPVQKAMAGFISETAIQYRASCAVHDHGGDGSLRAGDRMPDLSLKELGGILQDWKDAKHLAILVNAEQGEIEDLTASLRQATTRPVKSSDLDENGSGLLGQDKKILIVRPDGYIGFRGSFEHLEQLSEYARQDALT
jgi:2-polyprenyl-6-methoxyphenol hydroxylase-like FAD-dependent oxidoreductase